ncbi:Single-stranded-DNA-specific exonuclease RecJ [Weissella ceti]|uniref:Single-stranded-DNA-specific exonuclease RecJ n=2 Tax=Weissella TaxID=46255 RepID=A0A075TVW9_9LACO|nr:MULTISPECIES: single-stranded-DNA-specific exonuclease RecJ [Weissella]AIG65704.1 Single-stranded-DNA-specific exonuclease RecJ [Weissella tructae]AIM63020.1 Single-stranded-DNA-specific exonuclease RecJ [Weissella ceti]AIM64419.1 Single-stranded-DNA-specific exonuclease RecJ [Weissella ceti]ELA06843.1 single-strand DNA-specific exonuclease RecJ [Weissella ceti NC36]QVV90870.1 single-stranded-DNA-specific exonuclease RecJ [Weissella tructae]
MIEAQYQWIAGESDIAVKQALMDAIEMPELLAEQLVQRGMTTPEEVMAFLQPTLEQLHDPAEMFGMDVAVDRIWQAIDAGEKIVVYGDYDVDGMTSTAIMTWALELMGADVSYFVPSRFTEGYGPNLAKYQELAAAGMQLLVTVDNGVSGAREVAWLQEHGVDVIVTDHHELPVKLPEAVAIVHPQHPAGDYPFKHLSGAGVAFKVASALLEAPADDVLDLAALGTVADVMPLRDENRALVALGLAQLREQPRVGLDEMLRVAGSDLAKVDAGTIGFTIGPRLNAVGRLADPTLGVRLLLTEEEQEAAEIVEEVEALNQQRQALVESITNEAIEQAETMSDPVLVVTGAGWHEGVLGIVASRLVDRYNKPTIVLSEEDGRLKGSARSMPAFDLFAALDPHRDLFIGFGGHAGAAGMTLSTDNLTALRQTLIQAAQDQSLDQAGKAELMIAQKVTLADFTRETYDVLQMLAPFGEGNPEPQFEVTLSGVDNPKTMSDGKHIRFNGQTPLGNLPVVGFGYGHLATELGGRFDTIRVVGTMSENTFRGSTTYQMMLKDMEATGAAVFDWRTSKLTPEAVSHPGTYVFFNENIQNQMTGRLGAAAEAVSFDDVFSKTMVDTLILADMPKSLEQLSEVLQFVPARKVGAIFYSLDQAYLQTVPQKSDFAKVYRFTQGHQNVNLSGQFQQVADHLKMKPQMLKLIFKVFLEVEFVKIENGFLNPIAEPANVDLTETNAYQTFMAQRDLEKQLIYSTTAELDQLLSQLSQQEN